MTNKEVIIALFKAFDANDFETAEKLLGPDHKMHSTMSAAPMNAAQHIEMTKMFHTAFSNPSHEFAEVIEAGNKVVCRGTWHGTHTSNFNGIPPSGKTIHISFINIFEIENNTVKNQWSEMDGMSVMIQLGAMPAPAAM